MIRRSPAEFYIKYLLAHPDDYSDDDVVRVLREHQLDYPGGMYLERLRKRIVRPHPYFPYNGDHTASWRFLLKERISHLFHPDKKMINALKILHEPRAKEATEAMVLVNDPAVIICHRLQSLGIHIGPFDLQRYKHYFWNTSLVDSTEMRALLQIRVEDMRLEGDGGEDIIRHMAMVRANYMDPRHIAANSPVPEVAAMFIQMRMGYMPDRVDMSRLANSAASAAMSRALEELNNYHPDSAQRSRDFALVARNLLEMLELIGSPDEGLRKDLVALGLKTEEMGAVKPVDAITEGQFTAEMQLLTEGSTEDAGEDRR